jgi:hypothetical protein
MNFIIDIDVHLLQIKYIVSELSYIIFLPFTL